MSGAARASTICANVCVCTQRQRLEHTIVGLMETTTLFLGSEYEFRARNLRGETCDRLHDVMRNASAKQIGNVCQPIQPRMTSRLFRFAINFLLNHKFVWNSYMCGSAGPIMEPWNDGCVCAVCLLWQWCGATYLSLDVFCAFFILSFASVKSSTIWWHNIVSSQIDCTVVVGIDFSCFPSIHVSRRDCRQVTPSSPAPSQSQESILFHSFANWTDFQITWIRHAFDIVPSASALTATAHAEFVVLSILSAKIIVSKRDTNILFYRFKSIVRCKLTCDNGAVNFEWAHSISLGISKAAASTQQKQFFEGARARRNSQNDEFMMERRWTTWGARSACGPKT